MPTVTGVQNAVTDMVFRAVQKHFSFNLKDRLRVVPDIWMFRANDDPYLLKQKRQEIGQHFSIYWDGVFINGFDETDKPAKVMTEFWKEFTDLYEKKKIYLSKQLQKAEEDIEKAKKMDHEHQKKQEKVKKQQEVLKEADLSADDKELATHVFKELDATK